ncbi:MAG: N-acetylmuramoyl-L-alanine amidase [Verrucomicrobiota bacterium]
MTGRERSAGLQRCLRGAVVLVAVCLGVLGREARGFEWDVITYQNRDYVSAENIHEFYRFQSLEEEGKDVVFRAPTLEMRATKGRDDLYINKIRFILSYPVLVHEGKTMFSRLDVVKLIDPVLRPEYISERGDITTVILDPGHGGHDSGAKSSYGREKDLALAMAKQLKSELVARGLKVEMTRETDKFLTLNERVQIANRIPNALFVSVHFNYGNRSAKGIETYALSPQGTSSSYGSRSTDNLSFQGNGRDSENIALATAVHASVLHQVKEHQEVLGQEGPVDRGIKRARWAVLRGINKPAILFESGFITHPVEGKLCASSAYRGVMANAIADAVVNYRKALSER